MYLYVQYMNEYAHLYISQAADYKPLCLPTSLHSHFRPVYLPYLERQNKSSPTTFTFNIYRYPVFDNENPDSAVWLNRFCIHTYVLAAVSLLWPRYQSLCVVSLFRGPGSIHISAIWLGVMSPCRGNTRHWISWYYWRRPNRMPQS